MCLSGEYSIGKTKNTNKNLSLEVIAVNFPQLDPGQNIYAGICTMHEVMFSHI